MSTSTSRTLGSSNVTQDATVKYQLNDNIAVIGNWEGRELEDQTGGSKTDAKKSDVIGIDLEYRVEFK